MNTFAVDFFGHPLSYGDLAFIFGGLFGFVALTVVLGLLGPALREYRANKERLAEREAIRAIGGFPRTPLTDAQLAIIHGHPTLHQAEWIAEQKDWRKK